MTEIASDSLAEHRARAIASACRVADVLAALKVTALVTGSLARGEFDPYSDVDFLVIQCPRSVKYAIEGIVEDQTGDIPFDVVYLEEIPASRLPQFTEGAVSAADLR